MGWWRSGIEADFDCGPMLIDWDEIAASPPDLAANLAHGVVCSIGVATLAAARELLWLLLLLWLALRR